MRSTPLPQGTHANSPTTQVQWDSNKVYTRWHKGQWQLPWGTKAVQKWPFELGFKGWAGIRGGKIKVWGSIHLAEKHWSARLYLPVVDLHLWNGPLSRTLHRKQACDYSRRQYLLGLWLVSSPGFTYGTPCSFMVLRSRQHYFRFNKPSKKVRNCVKHFLSIFKSNWDEWFWCWRFNHDFFLENPVLQNCWFLHRARLEHLTCIDFLLCAKLCCKPFTNLVTSFSPNYDAGTVAVTIF